jgi:hypothetical protein
MKPCNHYQSWQHQGLNIAQCVEYYQGLCGDSLSEHYKQPCPTQGYPEGPVDGEGVWQKPFKGEQP